MIDVRRAGDRFTTAGDGVLARHAFSFGAHYDPENVGFGALVAHNDETLTPGHGYDRHPHAGVEIVTWVLEGELRHEDTLGRSAVLTSGTVQVLSAGRGVRHGEHASDAATRFVQMWLRPDEPDAKPWCRRAEVEVTGGLVRLASGVPGIEAPVRLGTPGAELHLARLADGQQERLPDASRLHVYVARGAVELAGAGPLQEGDASRISGEPGPTVTGRGPAEVLVWQLA